VIPGNEVEADAETIRVDLNRVSAEPVQAVYLPAASQR
jgi:hypothetical protein